MSDITLSSAVRANLNTLQQTASLLSDVQNKLATGRKVNSALDNPNSFFTASGLTSRANDLGTLLDDMGQSVQTLKAADEGISAITKLTESAKAKANQALQTQSQFERAQFATQYNDLLGQIEDLAKDSDYKGKNLLGGAGNELTTIFNEDNTSSLTVDSVDYTNTTLSTGLNLSDLNEAQGGATTLQLEGGNSSITLTNGSGDALASGSVLTDSSSFAVGDTINLNGVAGNAGSVQATLTVSAGTTVQDLVTAIDGVAGVRAEFDEATGGLSITSNDDVFLYNQAGDGSSSASLTGVTSNAFTVGTQLLSESGSFKVGDTLTLQDGNGFELGSLEVGAATTVSDLEDFADEFGGVSASFNTGTGQLTIESDVTLNLTSDNADFAASAFTADNDGVNVTAAQESGFATDNDINNVIGKLNTALSDLRSQASEFGTNLSTIEIRQDFTRSLINTLEEGSGLLTLADTNEEGANLLALQTRQQLASTSLSFASQADQNVLRLF